MPKRRIAVLAAVICCLALISLIVCRFSTAGLKADSPASMADLGLVLLDEPEGVSVLAVQDKSLADRANIHPGDILLMANGISFADVEQLERQLIFSDQHTIRLQLLRGADEYVTTVLNLQ